MAKVFDFDLNNAPRQGEEKTAMPPEIAFSDAIVKFGLTKPDAVISDGQIHRYGLKKADWYVYFPDPDNPGGAAGSWRDGTETFHWSYRADLTTEERAANAERIAKISRQREDESARIHAEAQAEVTKLWEGSPVPESHPYLTKKGVKAYDIRLRKGKGELLIPMRDTSGILHSLQRIRPDGEKLNWLGGAKSGHFHTIPGTGDTAYLVEGFATGATVHEATGATVYIAFDAQNLKLVAPLLKGRIVVAADNDHRTKGNPGITAAKLTNLPYIYPTGIEGTDFNDLAAEKGIAEVRRQLVPPENKFSRRVITGKDLHARFIQTLSMGWTIDKILPESSNIIVIFGPPSSGKSFVTLDMTLSIDTGIAWHGHKVKQKPVLYLAAEGQAGVLKRIVAWKKYHGVQEIPTFSLLPMPCIIDNDTQLRELLAMIRGLPQMPGVIVLDTLARSMQGDENSTADMGRMVNAATHISDDTNAQIAIVHHTGKDETKGPRGAIALTGATDTMFKVVRTKEPKQYLLICERQKDDEPFEPMIFDFEVVDTGYTTADAYSVTSLVPLWNPDIKPLQKKEKRTALCGGAKIAMDAYHEAVREHGEPPTEAIKAQMGELVLPTDKVLHVEVWRSWAYRKGISDGNDEAKKKAFQRARDSLIDKGLVDTLDGYYWLRDRT